MQSCTFSCEVEGKGNEWWCKVSGSADLSYRAENPILLIGFRRPSSFQKVWKEIEKVRPRRLYVFVDGARPEVVGEKNLNEQVKKICLQTTWDCELLTRFSDTNLGCRKGVSEAISWFFRNEEKGIILEDDCLPNSDFFRFSDTLLTRYHSEKQVLTVAGSNYISGRISKQSPHSFSKYFFGWGWATWRRTWEIYDPEMSFWPEWKGSSDWMDLHPSKHERRLWEKLFDLTYSGQIDTWDYVFLAALWRHGGLHAIPPANLVTNIGFTPDATHTTDSMSPLAGFPRQQLKTISFPPSIAPDFKQDRSFFRMVFDEGIGQSAFFKIRKRAKRFVSEILGTS